jgi:hypothetical protein
MPVKLIMNGKNEIWINPNADVQTLTWNEPIESLEMDPNYYAQLKLSRN